MWCIQGAATNYLHYSTPVLFLAMPLRQQPARVLCRCNIFPSSMPQNMHISSSYHPHPGFVLSLRSAASPSVLFSASSYPCLRASVPPPLLLPQSLSVTGVARSQMHRDETGVCMTEFAASFFVLSSDTVRYSISAQSIPLHATGARLASPSLPR
ncbi:hypothetical protein LZ31DRAFT_332681 [Colletotrichum somersetense]|nr:hypothetical protein LZ31DRAFT_332681 [Colletotrichum somersetense]